MRTYYFGLCILIITLMLTSASGVTSAHKTINIGSEVEDITINSYPVYLPILMANAGDLSPIIPESTNVLTNISTHYLSISEDGTIFTFSNLTPELASIDPGEVIAGDASPTAPNGFLRKVKYINHLGEQVSLITEPATLEEAVQQGKIDGSYQLDTDDISSGTQLSGVQFSPLSPHDKLFLYELDDVILVDIDGDPNTTYDQVIANGSISLEQTLFFDFTIKNFQIEEIEFSINTQETSRLGIEYKFAYSLQADKEIARHYFKPITIWIGTFPVVIVPVLSVKVGIDGNVTVNVTSEVTQTANLSTGVRYQNGVWEDISSFTNDYQYVPPTLTSNLDFKGYAGPTLSLLLYGLAGPYGDIYGYLQLIADINATPWYQLYGGLEVFGGVKVDVFGKELADYNTKLIDYKVLLLEASGSPSPYIRHIVDEDFGCPDFDCDESGGLSAYPADIDNDNDMDILARSYATGELAWFKNIGDGEYDKNTIDYLYLHPWTGIILPVDFDRDGDTDIIGNVMSSDPYYWNEIALWSNNGNGEFSNQKTLGLIELMVSAIRPADLDNDGDTDLVIGTRDNNARFLWWENLGDESFSEHILLGEDFWVSIFAIDINDINNDGYLDILADYGYNGEYVGLTWYINNKDKTFTQYVFDQSYSEILQALDLNQDEYIDVLGAEVVGGSQYDIGHIIWYRNDGDGNFVKQIIIEDDIVKWYWSIKTGDVDDDGDIDLIESHLLDIGGPYYYYNEFNWWENDGDENFTKHLISEEGELSIFPEDIDQDGDLDLQTDNDVSINWWEREGVPEENNNSPTIPFSPHPVDGISGVDINIDLSWNGGDLDGDNVTYDVYIEANDDTPDVIACNDITFNFCSLGTLTYDTQYYWQVIARDEHGLTTNGPVWDFTTQSPYTEHNIADNFDGALSVLGIDLDGDGDMDVVGAASIADDITWWENDGSESFTEHIIADNFDGAWSVYAIDLDTDGDVDVLGAALEADKINWWENNGSESFTEHVIASNFYAANSVFAIDLDSDGDVDVLGTALSSYIKWWENDGNENFTEHIFDAVAGYADVNATDLDEDGDIDVLGARHLGNEISWWENDGTNNFTKHTVASGFDSAVSILPIDMNGDLDIDLLGAAFAADTITWWENDGSENFLPHAVTNTFDGVWSVDAIDIENDGDIDILGAAYLAHEIAIWKNDGNEAFTKYVVKDGFTNARCVYATYIDSDNDVDILGAAATADDITWWEQLP